MILSQFLKRLKLALPNIGQTGVSDNDLINLLNEGCDQANLLCKAYKGYTDFNIEAEKRVYELSTYVPTFLGRDKRGLFFLNSDSDWEDIIPKTEAWLAEYHPDYLNATSVAVPKYYWIDGNELGFYPQPSTSQTSGARLYHLKKATAMTADTHYPFSGSTTEITALKPMDDAIIAFVVWQVKPAYGQNTDIDLGERRFLMACQRASRQMRRAPDLMNDSDIQTRT